MTVPSAQEEEDAGFAFAKVDSEECALATAEARPLVSGSVLLEDWKCEGPSSTDEAATCSMPASGEPLDKGVDDDDAADVHEEEASEGASWESVRLGCL